MDFKLLLLQNVILLFIMMSGFSFVRFFYSLKGNDVFVQKFQSISTPTKLIMLIATTEVVQGATDVYVKVFLFFPSSNQECLWLLQKRC